ncbi:HalOD1 output domain-containing protein [Haladaptatus sp. W1]|uniref:HalOD1 output domain-containing protein n=1 Tax=Haladaptatus sp. W1 TaxID=1897478 RepID=UPI000B123B8F|nr:HalOD1 output domain-containing protein [Haladaptatus sp. W1]
MAPLPDYITETDASTKSIESVDSTMHATNPHRESMNRLHGSESISQHVVFEVAEQANVQPNELPPLYDFIDPDALDTVVASNPDLELSFSFAGYRVTIDGEDSIQVREDD